MAGFVVLLKKKIKDGLNGQGTQKMKILRRKGLAEREE